jgi:FlaA1/EpsC-like NDP-sugar epimerase
MYNTKRGPDDQQAILTAWLSRWMGLLLQLPRPAKRGMALAFDSIICILSVYFAFYLRLGEWIPILGAPLFPTCVSLVIALPLFTSLGLYRAIFRYSDAIVVETIARAVGFYSVPFVLIYTFFGIGGVPRTVGLIQPLLLFLMVAATRMAVQIALGGSYLRMRDNAAIPRALIYGAGSSGRQVASAIRMSKEIRLFGFIDDNPRLQRSTLNGLSIFPPGDLPRLVHRHGITDILLAVPSASRARRADIARHIKDLGLHARTLPSMIDLARGAISVSDLKDLDIDDLLGRPPVSANFDLIQDKLTDKVVLVTGAGGSIGSELCRQILSQRPAVLLLIELSEFNLYRTHQELLASMAALESKSLIIPLLANIEDKRRIEEIFANWRPSVVFHAAAYKHVPLIEHNPLEGVRNNIFGTLTLARIAARHAISSFVLISTDKAVRPANIMGTTKRLAEMILQALHAQGSATCFSMVRFGNVLGSSGSVVPLFREQIVGGGPVTVTHPDIVRFFMTIPEAAQLVLQASAMANGGEVFVLDMGEPVKIADLARNMIELSGLTVRDEERPDGEIEIAYTGLRSGEKLYEELLIDASSMPTSHPQIFRARENFVPASQLFAVLADLKVAVDNGDVARARQLLIDVVPEYKPTAEIVDFAAKQNALRSV